MADRVYMGVDPGLSGAIALLTGDQMTVFDIPTHTITVNGARKRHPDLYALARWFDVHGPGVTRAVIEAPHALPGQGVTSMFNFGFVCGVLQGLVASQLIPMVLFRPSEWKRALRVSGGPEGKDQARQKASQCFPAQAHLFARKMDDGRAEAALLAWYGRSLG